METMKNYSHGKKNNFELYLSDIYNKECVFQIEKEEVDFIQTGIETLVQEIVDNILADLAGQHRGLAHIIDNDMYLDYILEVYFPVQESKLHRKFENLDKRYKETFTNGIVLKVGSFYDGARNGFPDEFDFIFVILGIGEPWRFDHNMDMESFVHSAIKNIVDTNEKPVQYTCFCCKHKLPRTLELIKSFELHGPAYMIKFIYNSGFGDQRNIHVDLVPAQRIIYSKGREWFTEEVKKHVEPKTFREDILAADSSLFVGTNYAFTEIEKHFMNNILSGKHMKVYRIIKYLLNGHGDCEELEQYLRTSNKSATTYTSYRVKILIIYHHEECKNTNTEDLGPCVLQILEKLRTYEYAEEFPKFVIIKDYFDGESETPFKLLPNLKLTIATFKSMKASDDAYNYERDKIKSISRQYLDLILMEK